VVYRAFSNQIRHVVGHNGEAFNLKNSACAERAAFLQLGGLAEASTDNGLEVLAVYITTDAPHAITPGALCREYMSSSAWTCIDATRIVMEGTAGKAKSRIERTLGELNPFASVYTRLDRAGQAAEGARRGVQLQHEQATRPGREGAAWRAAVAASARDARSELHPVSYGACAVYADGGTAVAWQKKALEYGCTLDAVCQLCQALEERADAKPAVLCLADQFGVCHAPFAPARAFLVEHGYDEVAVLYHDEANVLRSVKAAELFPGLPSWCA
jgi:cytidine deaminase